ncbi:MULTISPECIES: hypothetical protein [unclassified Micromonospora]|uniref:hypothetical protein n=1 Tax=unclassified Micromonospora TaxID=2617518 RepID=UPI001C223EA3|nr:MULTISPECIES: hypothetical protein [unclassified Micromonospora]MBU8858077.1 hypothetical protein [Micromonospora sp. WMMB482]MDM4783717.1 hypothetical protein [Micromonospora sp. b486]
MVMVNLPAARRHHRSRIGYALGLFLFLVTATALALAVRHPAFSATQQLAEPVPAPEITVAGEDGRTESDVAGSDTADSDFSDSDSADSADFDGSDDEDGWAATGPAEDEDDAAAGTGGGEGVLAERPAGTTDDLSRSLFYSGLLGLAISLAGLGLVGTRRRQW